LDKPQARQAFGGFRGAALNQSRSASGVYTGLLCWHGWGCQWSASCGRRKKAAPVRQQNMWYRIYSASSLTDSLRSVVRLRRAEMAYERGGNFLEDARKKLNREARRPRQSRFSIGSAPLTSITKSDAQISGGETRQDYKDTRRFPLVAPSCALLFLPFGLPVSFRCYGRGFSFHAWHSVPGRQFAPSWTVCTNPPFSPTTTLFPVTINLSPTRKGTTNRHWQ